MMVIKKLGLALTASALALALVGCNGSSKGEPPTVSSDGVGSIPQVTFTTANAPADTMVQQIDEAKNKNNPKVGASDLVVVDYYAQAWKGDVLPDSTLVTKTGAVAINLNNPPISGWKKLAGSQVGSRVLLTVPAAQAYGASGNESLGVAKDTAVIYVVDIKQTFNADLAKDLSAESIANPALPGGVSVSVADMSKPELKIAANSPYPSLNSVQVAKGNGPAVETGAQVVVRALQVDWSNKVLDDGWAHNSLRAMSAAAVNVEGAPVGSVYVLTTQASDGQEPNATLFQILGQYKAS